ncbi:MAG: SAM hydrolase/SAM-dependent halogenase family protein [Brevinema sp.]
MVKKIVLLLNVFLVASCVKAPQAAVVFQSDFGLKNNAVSAMYGVAKEVNSQLDLYNLSHEIPEYDIWVGAITLSGVISYWPKGTVFVSVVDPGVGTERQSVVAKTTTGHYIVTPDNGTLSFIADEIGIEEVRVIDEAVNRRANSEKSYTFHGRDVYSYTGARLASGAISFEKVGPISSEEIYKLNSQQAETTGEKSFRGSIMLIDEPYGNVWSNIPQDFFISAGIQLGDLLQVTISRNGQQVFSQRIPYVETFGRVAEGSPLLYINSAYQVSLALNMADFARRHGVTYGEGWTIEVSAI